MGRNIECVFRGAVVLAFVLAIFVASGVFSGPMSTHVCRLVVIAFGATVVESMPVRDIDNLTVPLVCVLLGTLLY